ncbi:hypothetical protein SCAR479_10465 [Seiridium cardinale]|uniref:Fucose-specific lectin n=1 Tax=Seiridium cardinale TaxID=138064 RepID=A0ABR2XGH9_9PEZI
MMLSVLWSLLLLLGTICVSPRPASAGSMAAWSPNGKGAQLIMQDDATGKIFYSLCNESDTDAPIFPNDESAALAIDTNLLPKNGSAISGVGWWASPITQAAISYLNQEDQIVVSTWSCDDTGHLSSTGQKVVSNSAPSIHPQSGLLLVVLGQYSGYRVYYHDEQNATAALKYNTDSGAWSYLGVVSNDVIESYTLGGGFVDADNITVVQPRDSRNLEVSSRQGNGTWSIATFPQPLELVTTARNLTNSTSTNATEIYTVPNNSTKATEFMLDSRTNVSWSLEGYDGNPGALGFTLDQDWTSNLWYLGNDSRVHQLRSLGGNWRPVVSQNESIWPRADSPSAEFATASDDSGRVWLFYMSGGNMTQVYRSSSDKWELPTVLQRVNQTRAADAATPAGSTGGLSTGAKAGVGVGVGVGGLAVIGIAALALIRRKMKNKTRPEMLEEHPQIPVSPAPDYNEIGNGGQWVDGRWIAHETVYKQRQPVHELPHVEPSHEMLGEGHARELDARGLS